MSEKRTSLEVIAPSMEEAVAKGLGDLGLPDEAVDIEVLDEGSKGLFGLGSRQARVRLTIKSQTQVEETLTPEGEEVVDKVSIEPADVDQGEVDEVSQEEAPELDDAQEVILHVARETVLELIERMGIDAEVTRASVRRMIIAAVCP